MQGELRFFPNVDLHLNEGPTPPWNAPDPNGDGIPDVYYGGTFGISPPLGEIRAPTTPNMLYSTGWEPYEWENATYTERLGLRFASAQWDCCCPSPSQKTTLTTR